jgi:acyl carrier protein
MQTVSEQHGNVEEQIKARVLRVLGRIAPESNLEALDSKRSYRDQFDFDSVDFMNLAAGIQEEFKIIISELDFPKLATLDGCIDYLKAKAGSRLP